MSKDSRRPTLESSETVPLVVDADPADVNAPVVGSMRAMLVIDENDVTRRAIVVHYRSLGWHVASTGNLKQAIDLALEQQPQVILIDLFMQHADARNVVRSLRTVVEHDVCVIGTAKTSTSMFDLARHAGVEVVLPKPLDLATVDSFLRAPANAIQ